MKSHPFVQTIRFCSLILSLTLTMGRGAEVQVASLFSDGMVLQQHRRIPVWGWGEPGQPVTVEFAGQKETGTVNADGTWKVELEAFEGGYTARNMVITVGDMSKTLVDVVVGEVWLCSGQSNMDYPLKPLADLPGSEEAPAASAYLQQVLNTADDPYLRQIAVPHTTSSATPLHTFTGNWVKGEKGNVGDFSATAYFFGRELREKLDVPVGLIKSSWGNTSVEAWMPEAAFRDDGVLDRRYAELVGRLQQQLAEYDAEKERQAYEQKLTTWEEGGRKGRKPRLTQSPLAHKHNPGTLFNAMIHPLIPYAMRGCIWYQGEANRFRPVHYAEKMAALIQSWRAAWGIGDFPFYYVQLAAFADPKKAEGWVGIQHEQLKVMGENNVGMAVANDIGEVNEIHPRNKVDVGKRLAAWALANEYGFELKAFSGPIFSGHRIYGDSVVVTFDHTGTGLMTGWKQGLDPVKPTSRFLQGFEIAGADGRWRPAHALIVSPNSVEVSHPEVPDPKHVRYAWSSYPENANLYNQEGYPASLFSTSAQ